MPCITLVITLVELSMYGCFMDQTGGHTAVFVNTTRFAVSEVVVVGRWVWMCMDVCDKVDTHTCFKPTCL